MLIFWKERLVFLANTKAGSTSLEAALESLAHVAIQRPPELKHLRASRYERHIAPLLARLSGERFTTLALMREPIDWLGSWYRYRTRDEIREAERSTAGIDFAEFCEAYLSPNPPAFAQVGSQARFLSGPDGAVLVDRVFRYEALDGLLHFLEDRLGCELTLPRMNVSPKAPTDLPDALRARLRERFAADYAIYEAIGRDV